MFDIYSGHKTYYHTDKEIMSHKTYYKNVIEGN